MSIVGNHSVPAGTIRLTGTRERRSGIIGSGSDDVGRRLFGEKKVRREKPLMRRMGEEGAAGEQNAHRRATAIL